VLAESGIERLFHPTNAPVSATAIQVMAAMITLVLANFLIRKKKSF
jgi:hypothetical protein